MVRDSFLFDKIHKLSMKAVVRGTVEGKWNIPDSDDGEISQLILSICLESANIEEFRARVAAVGVDPKNESVSLIHGKISRLKRCQTDLPVPVDFVPSKSSNPALVSLKRVADYEGFRSDENITGIAADGAVLSAPSKRTHMVSDYDLFEAQQMRKTGLNEAHEFLAMNSNIFAPTAMEAESLEIVKAEQEPRFLKGLTGRSGTVPTVVVPLVKDTEGVLQKAAINQSVLANERRELREIEAKKRAKEGSASTASDHNPALVKSGRSVGPKRSSMSIKEQRENLPIFHLKSDLLAAIASNQILIVIGETGSGKTTQMTQYLIETGMAQSVACTQPRRVAATSVAKRVAEELGCKLGAEVGYSIRFDDTTSSKTVIKYMTDGMLLREILVDPLLMKYNVIILDEAHERTVSTDVLFGLLKSAVLNREDNTFKLKLIVTSATLESEKFSKYFFNAPIFTIPGRTFPVEIHHAVEPHDDYLEAALSRVMEIHLTEHSGDILVFLTGQEEIDTAVQVLNERMEKLKPMKPDPLIAIPVYSALPSEMQTAIFDPAPAGSRKCVIATNIAEASVTIDGIFFVVDPGFAKIKMYNPKAGMDSLIVSPISQASARQRAGRAGRTGPGKCYRLYTEHSMNAEMLATNVPEIQRTNLSNVVLMLKAMGIEDLLGFDFMDKPQEQTLVNALETLWLLNALNDDGDLTKLGRRMAEFPMAPEESKMLLASVDLGCADDIITIVAMLSVQTIFHRPKEKQGEADERKRRFASPDGDHCTLLEVFRHWAKNNYSSKWCFDNYILERSLKRAQDVRKQLIGILDKFKLPIASAGPDYARIRKAICAGYFHNSCRRDHEDGYKVLRDEQQVYIHPSSVMYQKNPEYIIYHELVQTTREYVRDLCTIEPSWLLEIAPNLFSKADTKQVSRAKQGEKIKPLYNKFEDEAVWRLSKRFGK